MSQLEKPIETAILNFLKSIGIFAWKTDRQGTYDPARGTFRRNTNPHKIKGVSDILGLVGGRFLAIEVKSPKGRITEEQRAFLTRILTEGGIAFVARSVEQVAVSLAPHFPSNERLQSHAKEFARQADKMSHQEESHEEH